MEALVILLAEFLTAFLVPALVLAAEVAGVVLSLLLELVVWLCFGRRRSAAPAPKGPPAGAPKRSWRDTLQGWAALTVGALALANTLLFEPTVRLILAAVGQATRTELAFKSVSGDLFAGRLAFEEISARRASDTKSSFDLKARNLSLDLDLLTLLDPPIVFQAVSADTVTGTFRQPEKKRGVGIGGGRIEARRKFRIEQLTLTDIDIALSGIEGAPVAIALKSVTSAPLRSNFAVFDTLFRSNVAGQVDGHDISISTQRTDGGRVTQWRMPGLPAATVSRLVTRPPIGWLREGVLNVSVDDRWTLGEQATIHMDWNIGMNGVRAEVGEYAGLIERTLAVPIANYINARGGNVDLRFKLAMDESQFENTASLDAGDLWNVLLGSMASSIAAGTGEETNEVRGALDKAMEGFKGFLDRRRKPPGE